MSRSEEVYMADILESVELILKYIENKTEFDFINDVMLQDAIVRRFEIIGEATSRISEATKLKHPDIEWRLMKVMRNKMIHEYFGISPVRVYQTIHSDLPILKAQLQKIV